MKKPAIIFFLTAFIFIFLLACQPLLKNNDPCSKFFDKEKDLCYQENKLCSKIKDLSFRDSCVVDLAKIKKDVKVCSLIIDNLTKDYCLEQIAEINNNLPLCFNISSLYWRDICLSYFAGKSKNESLCSLIYHQMDRDNCFLNLSLDNHRLCFNLTENQEKCLFQAAVKTLKPEICSEINQPVNRDSCFYRVAKASGKKEICQLIKIKEIKKICQERFTVARNISATVI